MGYSMPRLAELLAAAGGDARQGGKRTWQPGPDWLTASAEHARKRQGRG